jgi:5,10-methylenetetrahydromethanopterin reductase
MIAVNKLDKPLITGEVMQSMGAAFSPARLREVLQEFEEKGATELAYQPAGPDITRELEKFITAAHG